MSGSRDPTDAEHVQRSRLCHGRQALLLLEVGHVDAAGPTAEVEVIRAEDTHPEADLRPYGIERRVECLLSDREVRDVYGHDPALAPHEQRERGLRWDDLERPCRRERV